MKNLKQLLMDRLAEMSLVELPDDVFVALLTEAETRADTAVKTSIAGITPVLVGKAFADGIKLRKKQQAARAVKP